ncbi:Rho GTPase-activating protein 26 [Gryllus bimaculatus]|nr:Rho GTPase-activating protein 26 [Gryllus bimaculatus]
MGVGLKPLEFYECLGDSPYFREKLHAHEQELQRTSHQIKGLIRELKDLLAAAKHLSKAQRTLSHSLQTFDFPCIGDETDDEMVIAKSLKDLGNLIAGIEDHRDIMLDHAYDQIILPLERFRKEHIGGVKEGKKKFEKQTAKFCMSQERYLNLSTKKQDTVLKEADAALAMEQRHFVQASLEYVFLLQEVQERKKFEFVETLLRFMFSWLTFYHQGHEVACDFKPVMNELQLKLQKTRANFEATRDQAESLRNKILERAMSTVPPSGEYTREGYLYLLEKKAFGSAWTKQYCMYNKDKKEFSMLPYNQTTGKFMYAKPGKVNSKSEERPLDDIGFIVSTHSERNLMTVSNLSMCFGPTLLRPEEETVAAIMDIKFYNVVVEVLIMNYDRFDHPWSPDGWREH